MHFAAIFSMKTLLLLLSIIGLSGCSFKKDELQKQEERKTSHWMVDPQTLSCARVQGTIENITSVLEQTSQTTCLVAYKNNPGGAIRKFECGNLVAIVSDTEIGCQKFVTEATKQQSQMNRPDNQIQQEQQEMEESTWIMIPKQNRCDRYPGSVDDMLEVLQTETKTKCKASAWDQQGLVSHIQCGKSLHWLVSEDEELCLHIQQQYNNHEATHKI